MAGDRTAIVAGGEGRNTPAAAHVASLALAGRASVASSLHRAARLATGSEHADGLAYPWHRRPPTTLAALRAGLADRYAVATAKMPASTRSGARSGPPGSPETWTGPCSSARWPLSSRCGGMPLRAGRSPRWKSASYSRPPAAIGQGVTLLL